jgi:N4-gp56 family major capsid protein
MADAYTGVGASNFDQTAFDLAAWYALRPELYFDSVADVRSTSQSFQGAAVTFTIQSDLSAATTTLNESTDVDATVMADTSVTLTLAEYGAATITTAKLRGSSYVPFDPIQANIVGFWAGLSFDTLARDVLKAGSNVRYGGASAPAGRTTMLPTDVFRAVDIGKAVAALRRGFVQPIGGLYNAYIHPDCAYDLRNDTGGSGWFPPHAYQDGTNIWLGEVGTFGGARFIEAPRAPIFADAGSSTTNTDIYGTLFCGQQALAKGYSSADGNGPMPSVVAGAITDKLRRNVPLGWYWFGTFGIFRQTALQRTETASSIGNNSAIGTN